MTIKSIYLSANARAVVKESAHLVFGTIHPPLQMLLLLQSLLSLLQLVHSQLRLLRVSSIIYLAGNK